MVLSIDFLIGKQGNKNILVCRLCLQNEALSPPLPLKPNRSLPQENWWISKLIPTLWKVFEQNKDSQSKWYYEKGREQKNPWHSYETQLVWRVVDASFHCRPSLLSLPWRLSPPLSIWSSRKMEIISQSEYKIWCNCYCITFSQGFVFGGQGRIRSKERGINEWCQ